MKVFVQDPESYLTALGVDLAGVMTPGAAAILEEDFRTRVNWEVYFFASEAARTRFNDNMVEHCGMITDPVTRERFRPSQSAPRIEHRGVVYFFSSDSTAAVFASMPDSLAHPIHRMRGMQ